jgi:hypothetical protein
MATLTINFSVAIVPPAFGYRIKYWNVATPTIISTTTVTTSPATITALTGTSYAGTVEAMCTQAGGSTAQSFTAIANGSSTLSLIYNQFNCDKASFLLTAPLTQSFTINAFSISGFPNTTCANSGGVVTLLQQPYTVPAGTTSFQLPMIEFGTNILKCVANSNLSINGQLVTNNTTFLVGGSIVTLTIDTSCKSYIQCINSGGAS